MIIGDKKKDMAGLILAIHHPAPAEPEVDAEHEALKSCAEEILHAIENKDLDLLTHALKGFLELHDAHEEAEEPEEELEHS